MRIAYTVLVGLVLLPGIVYAEGPEVQMVDGRVTISAQSVPLGQLLSLLDQATGMTSQVNPDLAGRVLSVRFSDLQLREAVRKIFEGQPLNYILIEGKGISVTDIALTGTSTSTPISSSAPIVTSAPESRPITTLAPAGPVQTVLPAQPANQPAATNTPFGGAAAGPQNPANGPVPSTNPGAVVPGQPPPPLGASNPFPSPVGGAGAPSPIGVLNPAPPAQPAGPGTLSPLGTTTPGGSVTPGGVPTR